MGELVEEGSKEDIFLNPLHPYTIGLMRCIPQIGVAKEDTRLDSIPGHVPSLTNIPDGCVFSSRCSFKKKECIQTKPELAEYSSGHRTACWIARMEQKMELQKAKKEDKSASFVLSSFSHEGEPFIKVENLKKYYYGKEKVKAVDGITVNIDRSCTLGVVGESGCGKTTLARCIIGLLVPTAGKIYYNKEDITLPWNKRNKAFLKKMQMVFQNPETSLNPAHTVRQIIARPLKLHNLVSRSQLDQRILELLRRVNLGADYMGRHPFEMSGGQKQRVAIARAFASDPEFVICDEPTSSLDVSVQASILNLLLELQQKTKSSYLFISHDLNVIYYLSDYIAITYLGKLCEFGPKESIFNPPYHPYTEALLSAIPVPDPRVQQRPIRLPGSVPSAINPPSGCRFHTRCPRKIGSICESKEPYPVKVGKNHTIYCHIPVHELRKVKPVISFKSRSKEKSGNK